MQCPRWDFYLFLIRIMVPRVQISYSIVIETDNLPTISWDEFEIPLNQLVAQIFEATRAGYSERPEIIFVTKGDSNDASLLVESIREKVPPLDAAARLKAVGVPDGRYYMLKNAGAEAATGDLIVFLDSDISIEEDWLTTLLSPFQDGEALISLGCTCLSYSDSVSRCFALVWIFPLRHGDEERVNKRPMFVNNCAFRRTFFLKNLFVIHHGFKVDCALLMRSFREQKIPIHRPPAFARHKPLRGCRFLVWRARVTGRDADRKYEQMKNSSRSRRLLHALVRGITHTIRVPKRILTKFQYVDLKSWQIPQAILLGWAFYTVAAFEQLKRALGLTRDQPEHVPDWVEHS